MKKNEAETPEPQQTRGPQDEAPARPKATEHAKPKVTVLERVHIDPQSLIKTALEKDAGIDILERLFALAKDVREQQAREAWYSAMAKFQKECKPITKTGEARILSKTGPGYRYTYAPLGEIMSTILPVMGPLGLSVSYRTKDEPDRIRASCIVSHEFGHSESSGEVSIPIEKANPEKGANAMQRVGIAKSYAKRYALLDIIGLAPEDDPDAQVEDRESDKVTRPRRASEKDAPRAVPQDDQVSSYWRGQIMKVTDQPGITNGRKWIKYVILGDDDTRFTTFKKDHADFAATAGSGLVDIAYTVGDRGNDLVTIEPASD